ncbi:TPA: DEAD/DEAH box helicase family protein [Streptococcus equi subsp. zooepidemicus]|uniref:type III restriction-modification system endonuclease n=1 Tax=Streptococcus equi TaxID=1336 RepID=UPI0002D3E5F6|nr:DEAD/DEAH box helicase family protein [Streptococcus equi]HEL0197925.1 DEAD/DEAH box helicase family protein [Streptococcus equi subsp. zooepidemicus]HEL0215960.1 DEAD/DEAH box helicase family protein [Streptococcus equi subsp. zooepidemicus]HEL0234142.1 DEAD/DEAH box helicase family protein [Streptococcus equi subsp. zooepidemicus]HEL0253929.1 DEAD/DEAH box helicase family protein [Streptococcus equi subsp. zooepidemicus]HEL0261715.1 DEAD/DEAH box helicase family protein [Streptococcus equ
MKLQFKHQKFQADAAKAVVDVFAGQPYLTPSYMMDRGSGFYQQTLTEDEDFTGWSNQKIVPELNDRLILEHINTIQRANQIKPSMKLEGRFNLTIEMETGVGKTYTYIKTMYELNRAYGWSKFIVVVPSIAIREGVYKSFQVTQEHFAEEYGKKIRFFIYNSTQLTEIDRFASDNSINVMIINSQAFNAKGKDARRIYMKLDEFRSRRPIDIIAKTNPIMIIDEPQSVEGKQTKENLKQFNPLMTLRYSATHKSDSIYNMIYRLDAMEAYNKRLVKKIAVKGITESGSTATESYIYLESINLSKAAPTATIQFDMKGATGIRKITRTVSEGYNLYDNSGQMEEYKQGFVVSRIDGRDDSVEFINGIKLYAGDVIGKVSEDQLRRIQIRETILSHIQRERELFYKGIKVLSLFFIDEVAKYKQYDAAGQPMNGSYAEMFEEEYKDVISNLQIGMGEDDYMKYLSAISADKTHAGYFSIDKKGKMIDSKVARKETTTDDVDAYDLIMKNKELLLDRNPKKSPVRFIFSHSALREGWDNPNVFQICTLKQSSSDVRKRQEVGRGLRLCVNQDGERMDTNVLGNDVHNVNVLTVIASESYDSFAKGLQNEIAEAVADRPKAVTAELFIGKVIKDDKGNEQVVDGDTGRAIHFDLIVNGYIDKKGVLTDKYYEDKANGELKVAEEVADSAASVIEIIDSIYDSRAMQPENARSNNVELEVDESKLAMPEFKALWAKINSKSVYVVDFDTDELVRKSIDSLDRKLRVSKIYFKVETGAMEQIKSKEELVSGASFVKEESASYGNVVAASSNVKYDLIGKLVDETGLTRKAVIQILQGIQPATFNQFKNNPEEFIIKAAALINDEKATAIIEHITYDVMDDKYGTDVFTDPTIKGRLGVNAMKAKKHLYDHIVYDSSNEQAFATELDTNTNVAVYVKLPDGFYISTPVGHYNPDWAIAFYEGTVKHIYFVAETKGSMNSMQLRLIEESKIHCAREHFKAISNGEVVYDVVDSYKTLLDMVTK